MFANVYRVNSNVTLNASNLVCSYAVSIHSGGFEPALSPGHRQTQGVESTRRWQHKAPTNRESKASDIAEQSDGRKGFTAATWALSEAIEHLRPMFVKDPIRPENPDAMARVADRISVPIAIGERFSTIYEFQALLSRNAVEFAQVDLALCGGITGAKKVAAIAEAHHDQVVPHNPLSPIGLAACLQLAACIPNFSVQEFATGFEAGVFHSTDRHLGHDIVDYVPTVRDGFVDIPQGPGLGVKLLDNATEIRPALVQPMTMRTHKDGFIVDQ
ncbi:2 oxo-3-deoxygalactonate 6-phosphate aldolase [Fusarium napiforme]|uniref:2 oxo-3-deoxygalactonate 6-phosphate aldolase n=1 Tax=Fusarium napiforme TaxID=42672 RepID=A0A8H5MZE9_9HYPO|nr:2 oxo-3-deoxygalactonate 6-phosphate aldolase [Fusarium napiforme]